MNTISTICSMDTYINDKISNFIDYINYYD